MHFCVVLWGFTSILGKLITLTALPLVWWRMTLVTLALALLPGFWKGIGRLSPRAISTFAGIGVLVALHWLAFYGSIKLSNASVAATCMALAPVVTSLVEPLIVGRPLDRRELAFGLAVIPGVALVVGGTPVGMRSGILAGIVSVFFVAVFGSLNKRFVEHGTPLAVTGIEMGAGALFLAFLGALAPGASPFERPGVNDAGFLIALAIGCTLVPFALSLVALRELSAFTTALAVNMEPVYAILLAILLLGEQRELNAAFYPGVGIILAVVFLHPLFSRKTAPVAGAVPPA
jgi:drug/metabolite transporter (DMT)-like permease